MHAAVVRSFERPPRYETMEPPRARTGDEVVVDVLAAGLHPRVRSEASGSHYTSSGALPLVPGIDGVARLPDGRRVYFVVHDTAMGTMAEKTVLDRRRCDELPDGVDEAEVAAAMNPAMSSWIALRKRIAFAPGQRVLVLGATGNAGQMAIQIAKRLGAGLVIGAGRNRERLAALAALGADAAVPLDGDPEAAMGALGEAAAEVDVVLDYLWGEPAERAMPALLTARSDRARPLSWIQIGSIAGPTIALPSATLRAANLNLMGSGQGSVAVREIVAELPALIAEIAAGALAIHALRVPLAEVESAWTAKTAPGQRLVFVPA